jgi:type I restriction enzyme S subunit
MTEKGWRIAKWSELAVLEYGRPLRDFRGRGGNVRVYGTNGEIGQSDSPLGPGPTVIVGRKGAYRGVTYAAGPFWVIDTAYWLRPVVPMDMRWAYYQLLTQDINGQDSGSAIPSLSRGDFGALQAFVPPLETQHAIGQVLGGVDDLLAANDRVAGIAERLVYAIYEAEMEGQPTEAIRLSQIGGTTKGVSYRSVDLGPASTAMVSLKSFRRSGGYQSEGLKEYRGAVRPEHVIVPGDVVVAQTDITQDADVVGRAVRIPREPAYERLIASVDTVIVRPQRPGLTREFLHAALATDVFRQYCRARANGTTVLHLAGKAVDDYEVRLPNQPVIDSFTAKSGRLWALVDSIADENARLRVLRQALIPELIAGRMAPEALTGAAS